MNTLLFWFLFIAFISLVIVDAFLTYIGIKRGHQERMDGTKKLIEKYGLKKGLEVKTLLLVAIGIFFLIVFFTMESIIPNIQLAIIVILAVIVILFSGIAIQNIVQLLKYRNKQMRALRNSQNIETN